jgi:prepilin-type N-terminal cleavage/methylation domain-containing protein
MRNVRGISLLEVLVTLLILAIAAVVSGPKPAF